VAGGARPGGILVPTALEERLAREKSLPPVVAAAGSESFLQDQVIRTCVAKALGDPDSPDAVVLHGPARPGEPDAPTLAAVLEDVRTPSLFAASGRKVVVLRRADALLAAEGPALETFLAAPPAGALLVLVVDAAPDGKDGPAAVRKALDATAARGLVVDCGAPSAEPGGGGSPSPLARWIAARAKTRGKALDPADAEFLVQRSGTVLATLDAAVAAAAIHAGDAPRISPADLAAVAPGGAAESTDRFVEALLTRDGPEALRILAGLYREGAWAWGAKSPTRGDASVTYLLLGQVRRTSRDARKALAEGGRWLPPSLRYGCRDAGRVLRRSTPEGIAGLLAAVTDLEAEMKSGASGGERSRFEALVLRHAGSP